MIGLQWFIPIFLFIVAGARDAHRIFEDDEEKCKSDLKTAMSKNKPWEYMANCRSYLVRHGVKEFTQHVDHNGVDPSLHFELTSKHKLSVVSKAHKHTLQLRDALAQHLGSQDLISDLISSAMAGPLDYSFKTTGGKSGSGFANMGNFPVKYGLRMGDGTFKYMNEPRNFEAMAPLLTLRFTEDNEHGEFKNERMPSLLNKIYFMLHLQLVRGGATYHHFVLILEDALYGLPRVAKLYNVPFMKFDLKGRSRLEGNKEFRETFPRAENDLWGGQLPLGRTPCNYFLSALMIDTLEVFDKLGDRKIIDYSLFVGVADLRSIKSRVAAYELEKRCAVVGEPLCFIVQPNERTRPMIVTFSIIDYLNDLNDSKQMESILIGLQKFLKSEGFQAKFDLYDRQIIDFASQVCFPTTYFEHVMNMLTDKEDLEEFFGSKEHLSTLARSW